MKKRLNMNNNRRTNGHEGKSFCLTLITAVNKIVVSDIKCHHLGYNDLIDIVQRNTQIPPKLISLVVGRSKLDKSYLLDMREKNIINVFVKGCGGAGDNDVAQSIKFSVICQSRNAFKYHTIKTMDKEKINVIQTMASKSLAIDEDLVCSKCQRIVARKITKSDHQPAKKQRVISFTQKA